MAGSFILLWVWFLARQAALKTPGGQLWWGWHALLLLALVAMIVITVRRVKRVQQAMNPGKQENHGFPMPYPPVNGRPKK